MGNDLTHIIAALIETGATGLLPTQFIENRNLIEDCGINRESALFWSACCAALDMEDAKNLFKGLVIAERELELTGGSVSGTIWILRHLDKIAGPDEMFSLIDWAFEHRRDIAEYTPLGVAIQKEVWKQVGRDAVRAGSGCCLDQLKSKAVEIRKERSRGGGSSAFPG